MATSGIELIAEGLARLVGEYIEGRWLGDDLVALCGLADRLAAQCSRRLGEFDARGDAQVDGHRSTVGWLADRCRMDPGDATRAVRKARALRALPSLQRAWEAGATTSAHVECLSRVRHRAKADELFDGLEHTWRDLAIGEDARTLARALAGFVDRLDNTRPVNESDAAMAVERRMLIATQCLGAGLLEARFELEGYEVVMNAIDHELDLQHVENDERTLDQQRADALVGICQKYGDNTDPAGENPPVVNVVIGAATFAGLEAGLCESDRGHQWNVETVRRLCCHAEIGRILVGEAGDVLDVGRTRRLFNRAQRRAMRYRDRGCCFPGCTRSVRYCRPHHIEPWSAGGPTNLDHGCMLCHTHHRLLHEQRWTIQRNTNGSIDWYRPSGHYHATWHPPGRPPIKVAA